MATVGCEDLHNLEKSTPNSFIFGLPSESNSLGNKDLRVYSLPASYPFIKSVAEGLFKAFQTGLLGDDLMGLSRVLIFLPYQRAIPYFYQHLEKLGRLAGFSSLPLPKVLPLGSLWHGQSAIEPFMKLGLMCRCIQRFHPNLPPELPPSFLQGLAATLGTILDQLYLEEIPLTGVVEFLKSQPDPDLQRNFLATLVAAWPDIVAACGHEEFYKRHSQQITHIITSWHTHPPQDPVIIAGSTGTSAAVTRLMQCVASLPQGQVILPGFDANFDIKAAYKAYHHPQYQLHRLIQNLQILPQSVQPWPWLQGPSHPVALARQTWFEASYATSDVSENPSQQTKDLQPALSSSIWKSKALDNLSYVACTHSEEEAQVIALIIREALEPSPSHAEARTILVITADTALGQRVQAALQEWNITVHNSAALSLAHVGEAARLWRLIAQVCRENPFTFTSLLAVVKHPLIRCSLLSPALQQRCLQDLELKILRQDPPPGSLDDVITLSKNRPYVAIALERLKKCLEIFRGGSHHLPLAHYCATYIKCLEDLCGSSVGCNSQGQALIDFFNDISLNSSAFPLCDGLEALLWIETLLKNATCQPLTKLYHPHVQIVGSMEARLLDADLIILGGMNEASWPPDLPDDPWLTPPLRQALGLPGVERRVGLAAHDFGQAFASPNIIITRSCTQEGIPTLPSRFLLRLEALFGHSLPCQGPWLTWARFTPSEPCCPLPQAPNPCPPLHLRPHQASVTHVQTWERNPYVFYVRHLMKLTPLPLLDALPSPAAWGSWIHTLLEHILGLYTPERIPSPACRASLIHQGLNHIATLWRHFPVQTTFYQQRFLSLIEWFFTTQDKIHLNSSHKPLIYLREISGSVTLKTSLDKSFNLKARADRCDVGPEGWGTLIDYKTGSVVPPTPLCQLRLEVAMASRKGFYGISGVQEAAFWCLKAPQHLGIIPLDQPLEPLIDETWKALEDLLERFLGVGEPYACWGNDSLKPYAHLSRWAEWRRAAPLSTSLPVEDFESL